MKDLTPIGSKINSKIGKAIHDHSLIKSGDNILVAVSGGKDSLALLYLLKKIQSWAPVDFNIRAIHVGSELSCGDDAGKTFLAEVFEKMEVEGVFRDIKVLDDDGRTSCFWCSWTRRKALFDEAEKLGCNKIALGHHKNDIAETILLNLLFKGETSGMNPYQELFEGRLALIRPLCYVDESMLTAFAEEMSFPLPSYKCPYGEDSERLYIKELIARLEEHAPGTGIKTNIINSLSRVKREYIET
ncbi:MAG: ATP-binding protein [Candidatus Omnitrophota bacterium]|nr:hypothetical protein [Candidatus Omnitrophota bacterium]